MSALPYPQHPRLRIAQWSELSRWDVNSGYEVPWQWPADVLQPLGTALTRRVLPVVADDLRTVPIIDKISFGGQLFIRPESDRVGYKGKLFWASSGELVYSKIRVKQGSVVIVPDDVAQVAVSNEYPVFSIRPEVALPEYLALVLRSSSFKQLLDGLAHGGSSKTRIAAATLENLPVPLPPLAIQQAILDADAAGRAQAAALLAEAADTMQQRRNELLQALSMPEMLPLSTEKALPITFAELSIWSVKSIRYALRAKAMFAALPTTGYPLRRGTDVFESVKNGCSGGPSTHPTTLQVLKLSAVTKGTLLLEHNKYITDLPTYREQFALQAGDVLICRTNGTLGMVGMSAWVPEDVPDMIYPDKLIRVRVNPSALLPAFLWRLLQLPLLRAQLEAAARTAVGNYAIGGADLWDLQLPIPPLEIQQTLLDADDNNTSHAAQLRQRAAIIAAEAMERVEEMILGNLFQQSHAY
jgi:type I restriction enzyme S subunit